MRLGLTPAALFAGLLLAAAPGLARSSGGLRWIKLPVTRAAPTEVFTHLGLTHITRNGYTRGLTKGTPDPTFPPGLTDVVPDDTGHALLVRGTAAGVAVFRRRVAAADVPDPRWQVSLTLLHKDGDDARIVAGQNKLAVADRPVAVAFTAAAPQYQVRVHVNRDGSLAVTLRTALVLAPVFPTTAPGGVLVPTQVWAAPVTKDVRPGDTLTFDDAASDRAAARRLLGQTDDDPGGDYQVQVQIAPSPGAAR